MPPSAAGRSEAGAGTEGRDDEDAVRETVSGELSTAKSGYPNSFGQVS